MPEESVQNVNSCIWLVTVFAKCPKECEHYSKNNGEFKIETCDKIKNDIEIKPLNKLNQREILKNGEPKKFRNLNAIAQRHEFRKCHLEGWKKRGYIKNQFKKIFKIL